MQSQTITFPISFPKSCYHVTWIAISTVNNAYKVSGYVNSVTRNSFYATADDINCQKYWLAIGVQQWGIQTSSNVVVTLPLAYSKVHFTAYATSYGTDWACVSKLTLTTLNPMAASPAYWLSIGIQSSGELLHRMDIKHPSPQHFRRAAQRQQRHMYSKRTRHIGRSRCHYRLSHAAHLQQQQHQAGAQMIPLFGQLLACSAVGSLYD